MLEQIIEKKNSEKGENVEKKKGKMNFPHKKTLLIPYFFLPLSPKKKELNNHTSI